jgi:hypothetical protein
MGLQHEGYVFNFNGTHPTIFLLADVRGALLGISEIDGRRNLEKKERWYQLVQNVSLTDKKSLSSLEVLQ